MTRIPAPAPPKGFRPHMPLSVKLKACLYALGFGDEDHIEWDHSPALQLRVWDAEAGDTRPAANDPRFIVPRRQDEHAGKTNGTKATTRGSDKQEVYRARRLAKAQEAHVAAMQIGPDGKNPAKAEKRGPKIAGRGFDKGHRPLRSKNTFNRRQA